MLVLLVLYQPGSYPFRRRNPPTESQTECPYAAAAQQHATPGRSAHSVREYMSGYFPFPLWPISAFFTNSVLYFGVAFCSLVNKADTACSLPPLLPASCFQWVRIKQHYLAELQQSAKLKQRVLHLTLAHAHFEGPESNSYLGPRMLQPCTHTHNDTNRSSLRRWHSPGLPGCPEALHQDHAHCRRRREHTSRSAALECDIQRRSHD